MADPPMTPKEPSGESAKIDWPTISAKYEMIMGKNARWNRINKTFLIVFLIISIPMYVIGQNEQAVRLWVYYIWRGGFVGMFSERIPYDCYNFASGQISCSRDFLEYGGRLNASLDIVGYIVGGAISIRISSYCIEKLEDALGIDLLSRLIDKFLPGPKHKKKE